MTTQMIQLQFANAPLFGWANQCGIPGDDQGYVLHNALVGLFGDHRPRPFGHWNKGPHTKVLGYTTTDAQAMRAHALEVGEPLLLDALKSIAGKAMPERYKSGALYGFEARVSPIANNKDGKKKDPFLAALDRGRTDATREEIYLEWFARRLESIARPINAEVSGFDLARSRRSTHAAEGPKSKGGITIPDVRISGHLLVEDPERFGELFLRGLGKHKAFGYGAIFLRPAKQAA